MFLPQPLKCNLLTEWQENGVDTAIQSIYRDMEYATVLIEAKANKNAHIPEGDDVEDEEEWTFIGEGDEDVSDDEAADMSSSRHLPSKSVIWTGSAPTGDRSPHLNRDSSGRSSRKNSRRKSSSTESGRNPVPTKERGR